MLRNLILILACIGLFTVLRWLLRQSIRDVRAIGATKVCLQVEFEQDKGRKKLDQ
jgi:hypothetical protein